MDISLVTIFVQIKLPAINIQRISILFSNKQTAADKLSRFHINFHSNKNRQADFQTL